MPSTACAATPMAPAARSQTKASSATRSGRLFLLELSGDRIHSMNPDGSTARASSQIATSPMAPSWMRKLVTSIAELEAQRDEILLGLIELRTKRSETVAPYTVAAE